MSEKRKGTFGAEDPDTFINTKISGLSSVGRSVYFTRLRERQAAQAAQARRATTAETIEQVLEESKRAEQQALEEAIQTEEVAAKERRQLFDAGLMAADRLLPAITGSITITDELARDLRAAITSEIQTASSYYNRANLNDIIDEVFYIAVDRTPGVPPSTPALGYIPNAQTPSIFVNDVPVPCYKKFLDDLKGKVTIGARINPSLQLLNVNEIIDYLYNWGPLAGRLRAHNVSRFRNKVREFIINKLSIRFGFTCQGAIGGQYLAKATSNALKSNNFELLVAVNLGTQFNTELTVVEEAADSRVAYAHAEGEYGRPLMEDYSDDTVRMAKGAKVFNQSQESYNSETGDYDSDYEGDDGTPPPFDPNNIMEIFSTDNLQDFFDNFLNKVLGFIVLEKGECRDFPTVYSVNLICAIKDPASSVGIGKILLGAAIHCLKGAAAVPRHRQFILELAGGYTNIAGLCAYSALGFGPNTTLYGANCFPDYSNLPMLMDLNSVTLDELLDLVLGDARLKHPLCIVTNPHLQILIAMLENLYSNLQGGGMCPGNEQIQIAFNISKNLTAAVQGYLDGLAAPGGVAAPAAAPGGVAGIAAIFQTIIDFKKGLISKVLASVAPSAASPASIFNNLSLGQQVNLVLIKLYELALNLNGLAQPDKDFLNALLAPNRVPMGSLGHMLAVGYSPAGMPPLQIFGGGKNKKTKKAKKTKKVKKTRKLKKVKKTKKVKKVKKNKKSRK